MKKGGKNRPPRMLPFLGNDPPDLTIPWLAIHALDQAIPWDLLEQLHLLFTFSCIHARNLADSILESLER